MTSRKALTIGNNYYGDMKLEGCVNDAKNMAAFMKPKGYTTDVKKELSHDAFVDACRKFSTGAKQGDMLLFHFSGHGFQTPDNNGDEEDGLDEAVVLGDGTGFTDDDINQVLIAPLKNLKLTMVIIFDTCHSGTMCDLRYIYKSGRKPTYNPNYPVINATVISISGCGDTQTSADTVMKNDTTGKMMPQGALTGSLLAVLKKCDGKENLCDFMDKLRYYLHRNGYTQLPVMCSSRPIDTLRLRDVGLLA